MLEKILGSELKIKMIDFFLSQEENKVLSYSDISNSLNLKGSTWRRDLNDLLDINLLKLSKDSNLQEIKKPVRGKKNLSRDKIFFNLNSDFFLLPEIKTLLAKTKVLLSHKLFKEMEVLCRPKLLVLTGKFINKNEYLTDLLIVGDINRRNFLRLISELEKTMNEEINYSIMTEDEFKYRRYVMDIFLYEIINNNPIVLLGNIDELNFLKKNEEKKNENKD